MTDTTRCTNPMWGCLIFNSCDAKKQSRVLWLFGRCTSFERKFIKVGTLWRNSIITVSVFHCFYWIPQDWILCIRTHLLHLQFDLPHKWWDYWLWHWLSTHHDRGHCFVGFAGNLFDAFLAWRSMNMVFLNTTLVWNPNLHVHRLRRTYHDRCLIILIIKSLDSRMFYQNQEVFCLWSYSVHTL